MLFAVNVFRLLFVVSYDMMQTRTESNINTETGTRKQMRLQLVKLGYSWFR